MKSFKFVFLGLGLCLIIASFIIPTPQNLPSTQGPNYVLDKEDGSTNLEEHHGNEGLSPTDESLLSAGEDLSSADGDAPSTDKDAPSTDEDAPSTDENSSLEIKTIIIPKGAYSNKVAELIFEKGLIPDKDKFNARLIELELDRRILYGTFKIQEGLTVDKIIKVITGEGF